MTMEKTPMWRAKLYSAVAMMLMACFTSVAMAQEQGPKIFASASDASEALLSAIRSNDEPAILDILGPDGKTIVSSGDAAEDASDRANIARRYQEMHRLVTEPDGTVTLYMGARNWPLPIPLVGTGRSWHFDAVAGQKEILYRRVGKNEIASIRVCHELVAVEKEYYFAHQHHYAAKIISDTGQHDGLYWKAEGSEPKSPIGPMLAFAVADAAGRGGVPTPYHGYFYRMLASQGKGAAGFAFVAYPAQYRSSGVMSFIVDQDGVVYEKDLGENTAVIAKAMKAYDPDPGWNRSEDAQEKAAAARLAK
jgi:hypothetical protein